MDAKLSLWERLFLEERPSIGLAFFRLAVAFTVGAHLIPTLLHLDDNYLSTAFKETNSSFFTPGVIELAARSPDGLVYFMTIFFYVTLAFFAAGLFSQISCLLMTACCYYFYALNSLHIGTLSYDILLVTLFLMCVTGYHGDFFSLDALRVADPLAYKRKRPFFVQRLLQLQVASTFFYTGLCKVSARGNWLTDNPVYYLLNSTPESVVKHFPLRETVARHPDLCWWIGIGIVGSELALPFFLFIKRTRALAIAYGFFFHVMLLVTLHVPTIFFFLFPPQLLLFIDPETVVHWIEKKRRQNELRGQERLVYDGHCRFCIGSVQRIQVLDLFRRTALVNYQEWEDVTKIDPRLTRDLCHSRMQLLAENGKLYEGFFAFRHLAGKIVLLWPLAPFLYLPGMSWAGSKTYDFIAKNRYLFHNKKTCTDNACFR
ncbi:MAG: DCC1-like thiol-disulfide oxidoreductase family protein [Candidatus Omnitrophota bacterium]